LSLLIWQGQTLANLWRGVPCSSLARIELVYSQLPLAAVANDRANKKEK